jgi:REP element-mobilizing transposase RayT
LKEWDYSNPAWYYITINTRYHFHYFGAIKSSIMQLNELGSIAEVEWRRTKELRKNVELDYFIIMPNHIHGILIINDGVETRGRVSLQTDSQFGKPVRNSLSTIINQYKGTVARRIHSELKTEFYWQKGFYDRIIRNEKELYCIRNYIDQNPFRWGIEEEGDENIFMA